MKLNILIISLLFLTSCKTTLSGVLLTKDNQPIKPTDGKVNIFKINDDENPISMVIDITKEGRLLKQKRMYQKELTLLSL